MVTKPKNKITTLNISFETKERIDAHGRFKETYDDILNRLLNEHDKVIEELNQKLKGSIERSRERLRNNPKLTEEEKKKVVIEVEEAVRQVFTEYDDTGMKKEELKMSKL